MEFTTGIRSYPGLTVPVQNDKQILKQFEQDVVGIFNQSKDETATTDSNKRKREFSKEKIPSHASKVDKCFSPAKENVPNNIQDEDDSDTVEVNEDLEIAEIELNSNQPQILDPIALNAKYAQLHMDQQMDDENQLRLFFATLEESSIPKEVEINAQIRMNALKSNYVWGEVKRSFDTEKIILPSQNNKGGEIAIGIGSYQGIRLEMQDEAIATSFSIGTGNNVSHFTLLGIFDGHGPKGKEVAEWLKLNVVQFFQTQLSKENSERLSKERICGDIILAGKLMNDAIPIKNSGSTAALLLIHGELIFSINLGDSRAILLNEQHVVTQGNDSMRPNVQRHLEQLEKRGGKILQGKVNGYLSVTGAFGHQSFDSSISDYFDIACYPYEEFKKGKIIIASDGLWDVISSKKLGSFIFQLENKGEKDVEVISQRIAYAASKHSTDNVKVIVARLPESK